MKLHQNITTISADLETPVGLYLKIRDLYPCSALLATWKVRSATTSRAEGWDRVSA